MEFELTKQNILNVKEFIESHEFIENMNKYGLQFEEMAFILDTLLKTTQELLEN